MLNIIVALPRDDKGNAKLHHVTVVALPPIGSYLAHDKLGFSGRVDRVDFWWDEQNKLTIEVGIK